MEVIEFNSMTQREQRRCNKHLAKTNRYIENYNRRPMWLNRLLRFLHLI